MISSISNNYMGSTEMGRKTTTWVLQGTNWRNLRQKDVEITTKGKL